MGTYFLGIVWDFCFFFASAHLMRALIVYNMYKHTHIHTDIYTHTHNKTHTYMCTYMHTHTCACMHIQQHTHNAYIHTHASMHIYIHNTYTHILTCIQIHACIYAYTCTHIHAHIPTALLSIQTQSKPPPGPWTYLFFVRESHKSDSQHARATLLLPILGAFPN